MFLVANNFRIVTNTYSKLVNSFTRVANIRSIGQDWPEPIPPFREKNDLECSTCKYFKPSCKFFSHTSSIMHCWSINLQIYQCELQDFSNTWLTNLPSEQRLANKISLVARFSSTCPFIFTSDKSFPKTSTFNLESKYEI